MKKIVIIGAGNVGFHLGKSLLKSPHSLVQVVEGDFQRREKFSEVPTAASIQEIDTTADIYILSVQDQQIEKTAKDLKTLPNFPQKALIVHVSGTVSINILAKYFNNVGVFYFLQTFSLEVPLLLKDTPLCIETLNPEDQDLLQNVGSALSEKVVVVDSEQRKKIHLAAVFACNFSNLMYSIASRSLTEENLDFTLLKSLILQTAQKAVAYDPAKVQTGPAVRGDLETIAKHLDLLKNKPDELEIYKLLTEKIQKEHGQL